jgi:branched-chain amino acid transport system ATP-binding protein
MPLLEVSNLRVSYGKALAIESVSIEVNKAELVGVLGPNGAGKTTLLKAISRSIVSQASSHSRISRLPDLRRTRS